jgi:hypothetical protein
MDLGSSRGFSVLGSRPCFTTASRGLKLLERETDASVSSRVSGTSTHQLVLMAGEKPLRGVVVNVCAYGFSTTAHTVYYVIRTVLSRNIDYN